jgi:hypothetical protein
MATLLLERGADNDRTDYVRAQGQPRAHGLHTIAMSSCACVCASVWRARRFSPLQSGQNALYLTAEHGQPEIAKLLLLAGASVKVQNMVRRGTLRTHTTHKRRSTRARVSKVRVPHARAAPQNSAARGRGERVRGGGDAAAGERSRQGRG